ncbi:hypothetical protein EV2_006191 [Malus domestica]
MSIGRGTGENKRPEGLSTGSSHKGPELMEKARAGSLSICDSPGARAPSPFFNFFCQARAPHSRVGARCPTTFQKNRQLYSFSQLPLGSHVASHGLFDLNGSFIWTVGSQR